MADTIFEDLAELIATQSITAEEIVDKLCSEITPAERQALLNSLADKYVRDLEPTVETGLFSGILDGQGSVEVPSFLSGRIVVIDTDYSATDTFDGTHQYVTDSIGNSFPEETSMDWGSVPGRHYPPRTITAPAGVKILYTFSTL